MLNSIFSLKIGVPGCLSRLSDGLGLGSGPDLVGGGMKAPNGLHTQQRVCLKDSLSTPSPTHA